MRPYICMRISRLFFGSLQFLKCDPCCRVFFPSWLEAPFQNGISLDTTYTDYTTTAALCNSVIR